MPCKLGDSSRLAICSKLRQPSNPSYATACAVELGAQAGHQTRRARTIHRHAHICTGIPSIGGGRPDGAARQSPRHSTPPHDPETPQAQHLPGRRCSGRTIPAIGGGVRYKGHQLLPDLEESCATVAEAITPRPHAPGR